MWPVAQALQKARAMAVMLALASAVALKKPNHAVFPVPQVAAAQAADLERARQVAAHQAAVPAAAIAADHLPAAAQVQDHAAAPAADLKVVEALKAAASKKAASKKLALKRPAAFKAVHDNF